MRHAMSLRALCLALAFASCAGAGAAAGPMPMPGMPGMSSLPLRKTVPGMSVYNISSSWTTQAGRSIALSSLRGGPVVAAMVYTHCPDVCPLITERMQMIEQALPPHARDAVRFVLVSLDWARDSPSQLAKFAAQHRLDMNRWTLLHGDEMAVRELANVLGVDFYRNDSGNFQHSIAIFLLDRDGVVKMQQTDMLAPPAAMTAHILGLLREKGRHQQDRPR